MIKLIGLKRIIILSVLLALNLIIFSAYFIGIFPQRLEADSQLAAVQGEISELRGKIGTIKQEMAYLQENVPKYRDLEKKGFFLNQDRFLIGRMMEELRVKAGITSFSFQIADVEEIPNPDAAAMGHRLVNSRITVDSIVSPLDNNVYILMQEMNNAFPEYARMQSLNVTRTGEVTEQALADLSLGRPVNFVNATFIFDWMTLVPKPEQAGADGAAGFRRQ
jgi:hypothetical protein